MANGDRPSEASPNGTVLPDDPELRNRMRLREEFRMELLGGLDWLVKSENHLLKIFRFYILVLGAFISIISFRADNGASVAELLNFYTVSGIVFWTVAVLSTVFAFAVMSAHAGLDRIHRPDYEQSSLGKHAEVDKPRVFEELNLDGLVDQPPKSFEDDILHQYVQSIHFNEAALSRVRYPFLYVGMFLMAFSVLLFGVGMLVPDLSPTPSLKGVIILAGKAVFVLGGLTSGYLFLQTAAVSGQFLDGLMNTKARTPHDSKGLGYFPSKVSQLTRAEDDET